MSEILFKCTIPGRSRILKNSKRIARNSRTKKIFLIPSTVYERWALFASVFISRAKKMETIDFPVHVCMKFYFKNHAHEADLDNLFSGPNDLLQSCDIIKSDKLIYSYDGSRKIFGEERERVEIEIKKFADS